MFRAMFDFRFIRSTTPNSRSSTDWKEFRTTTFADRWQLKWWKRRTLLTVGSTSRRILNQNCLNFHRLLTIAKKHTERNHTFQGTIACLPSGCKVIIYTYIFYLQVPEREARFYRVLQIWRKKRMIVKYECTQSWSSTIVILNFQHEWFQSETSCVYLWHSKKRWTQQWRYETSSSQVCRIRTHRATTSSRSRHKAQCKQFYVSILCQFYFSTIVLS